MANITCTFLGIDWEFIFFFIYNNLVMKLQPALIEALKDDDYYPVHQAATETLDWIGVLDDKK